jgi:hypothetical protein
VQGAVVDDGIVCSAVVDDGIVCREQLLMTALCAGCSS